MKKNILIASVLLSSLFNAQRLDAVNKIFPPAPTANSLMKFEEVPVSLYTGIPDISIPIYTLSTNKIEIPVRLGYHTLSAKPDEFATEVGLGWNLIAGGSITRTVKGLPDEAIKDNLGSKQGIGIYIDEYSNHPNFSDTYRNYTAKYLDIIANNNVPDNDPNFKKYAFESAIFNRYDTQYDLYQYNFLGYTGRFIIRKNSSNGFQVVKLDKNNLKITSTHNSLYEPVSFIIVDELGRKYIFDVTEKTKRTSFVDKTSQLSNSMPQATIGQIDEYNSSFHISTVKNENDQNLAVFEYNPVQGVNISSTSNTANFAVYSQNYESLILNQIDPYLPPRSQSYTTNTSNKVRTLKRISLIDNGIIDFIYTGGREDTGFSALPYKLSEIQIKDNSERIIEKVSLIQGYSTHTLASQQPKKRMMLNEVVRKNSSDGQISKYSLNYYANGTELSKDAWGYFKCNMTTSQKRSMYGNNGCSDYDVLKSIIYPTGGKSEFIYETNTFSYMPFGTQQPLPAISSFEENPDNWSDENLGISYTKFKETEKYFFKINAVQDVTFNYNFSSIPTTDWRLELLKGDGTIIDYNPAYTIGTLYNSITSPQGSVKIHMEPGYYYARLDTDDANMMFQTFSPVFINSSYSNYNNQNALKYLYGGGIRIKDIQYKDSNNSIVKQKSYAYQNVDDTARSSGALVFPFPVINYSDGFNIKLWYTISDTAYGSINYNNTFKTTSRDNVLPILKTRGGDIGYENVAVFETEKGKNISYYKSPRLYPNTEIVSTTPPFLPITDEDFKRGYLIKEQVKDNNNMLLIEKSLDYTTQTSNIYTGILIRQSSQNPYLSEFETYDDFLYYKQNCGTTISGIKCAKIEDVATFPIQYNVEKSILAGVNNTSLDTKNFFNNSTSILEKTSTVYNALDLPIQKKITSPDGTINESNYSYAHEKGNLLMIDKNMIGIPLETTETQTVGSTTKTLEKTETLYPISVPTVQTGNLVLPLSVKSYDTLNNTPSTDVTYDKYDEKGNIIQYTTKDGVPTTIIWGYNKTQPIAKIEGMTYDQLLAAVSISTVVAASDQDASDPSTETALLNALNDFRKQAALADKMITTYTYDPLIGVTSITPTTGVREVYVYDSANRLKEVKIQEKDTTGNYVYKKVKEFNYNYKP